MASLDSPFWRQDCRGPGLSHTHSQHATVGEGHDFCPCRDCGLTPARVRALMGQRNPDDQPLELPQPESECGYRHESRTQRTEEGWEPCPGCKQPLEPKMATGQLTGALWGSGRGWVNPRTRKKWEAIAYRAMQDREGLA